MRDQIKIGRSLKTEFQKIPLTDSSVAAVFLQSSCIITPLYRTTQHDTPQQNKIQHHTTQRVTKYTAKYDKTTTNHENQPQPQTLKLQHHDRSGRSRWPCWRRRSAFLFTSPRRATSSPACSPSTSEIFRRGRSRRHRSLLPRAPETALLPSGDFFFNFFFFLSGVFRRFCRFGCVVYCIRIERSDVSG